MITRSLGEIILGKATPLQLCLACWIGCTWAFLPGLAAAPGSVILLLALLLVINANLPLTLIILGLAKFVSLLQIPLTFMLGVKLMEGPMGPLFVWLINTPGVALMGFDHYLTAGGWLVGGVYGLGSGLLISRWVIRFRSTLVSLDENSERYQSMRENKWTRFLVFLLFAVDLTDLEHLKEPKQAGPIRVVGVVVVALSAAALYFVTPLLEKFIAKTMVQQAQELNQATVDVDTVQLDLKTGMLGITGLAVCDKDQLDRDLLSAQKVTLEISVADLLAKRLVVNHMEATGAAVNAARKTPGTYYGPEREPLETIELDADSIEQYLENGREIYDKLNTLKERLESLAGEMPAQEESPQSFQEWLEAEVAARGYAGVTAPHLIEATPAALIRSFKAGDVRNDFLPDENLDIEAFNLSTHPSFLTETPQIKVRSSKDNFLLDLDLSEVSAGGETNAVNLVYRNAPVEMLAFKPDQQYLTGGTFDCELAGDFKATGGSWIELPVKVTLKNTNLKLPKYDPVPITSLPVTVFLKGPINKPSVRVDKDKLEDAVKDALKEEGKKVIKDRAAKELEKLFRKKKD